LAAAANAPSDPLELDRQRLKLRWVAGVSILGFVHQKKAARVVADCIDWAIHSKQNAARVIRNFAFGRSCQVARAMPIEHKRSDAP
jgi:hypothetical protein